MNRKKLLLIYVILSNKCIMKKFEEYDIFPLKLINRFEKKYIKDTKIIK